MANVINMGGGGANVQSKTVKSTTTQQTLTPPSGVDGFSPVVVQALTLGRREVTPSDETQLISTPSGYDAMDAVIVNPQPNKIVTATQSGLMAQTIAIAADITTLKSLVLHAASGSISGTGILALCYTAAGFPYFIWSADGELAAGSGGSVSISNGFITITLPSGYTFANTSYTVTYCGT